MSRGFSNGPAHRFIGPIPKMPNPAPAKREDLPKWGTVESVYGDVQIIPIVGDAQKAQPGMVLRQADAVETGSNGSTSIRNLNGHSIYVTDKSSVTLYC